MTCLFRRGGAKRGDAGIRIRRMGCHEGYQLAMHLLDQYRGTVVACRYYPPLSLARPDALEALKSRFYGGVARVVLAQPHLYVGITGENSRTPAFVRLDRLDLRNHVDWRSLTDSDHFESLYLESMQLQLDSRFDHLESQPGWRVIVLHKIGTKFLDVLYVWNHPHHDGMSGKIFHQHLLRNLNESFLQDKEPIFKVSEGPEDWILNLPDPTYRLPPNPELLSSWPMTPSFFVKALWKEVKPLSIFGPSSKHAVWAPIRPSPFTTRFRSFTLDDGTVTKVVDACRSHHTTLTSLIQALVLVSMTSALKDMKGFASRTPYDLRHILPSKTPQYPWLEPKESICNYVSVVDHDFNAELVASLRSKLSAQVNDASLSADVTDIIWSVSARVRREIKARLDSGLLNDLIGIMKLCWDWRSQQQSEARKTRYLSWLVTNLGVLDSGIGDKQGQEESWSLRRAELVLSTEVPSAALSVSIMTVEDEQMCVTCSWQDCVVDQALGEQLMHDLERWLNEIAS